MTMFSLRQAVMFRSMRGGGCKVRDTVSGKVLTKSNELPAIIRIKVAEFVFEFGFREWFKGFEYSFYFRLFGKRE